MKWCAAKEATVQFRNHTACKSALSLACAAMLAIPVIAKAEPRFTKASEIDLAVEIFTGKPAGTIGGARNSADPRLRLARCSQPLTATWHGSLERVVRVACEGASPWHVFIALRSAPKLAKPDKPALVVRRGDTVTIAVEGAGFTVRRPGEALKSGAIGDWITVKTGRKAEPVSAKIVRPGRVVIPF
jgi:flagella basal body P-ring formation protein FlgA